MKQNSFKEFKDYISYSGANMPATTNLYEVIIPEPKIFGTNRYEPVNRSIAVNSLNYYANNVSLPSRAVTTGEINNIGMIRRFATGQTNSEINIQFIITKDQRHRYFYEQWSHHTASDSDNTVAFYDDYVSDLTIKKYENGARGHQQTAVFKIFGAFPFNVSQVELSNDQTDLMQLDVSFYFERYRMDQTNPYDLAPRTKYKKGDIMKAAFEDNSVRDYIIEEYKKQFNDPGNKYKWGGVEGSFEPSGNTLV